MLIQLCHYLSRSPWQADAARAGNQVWPAAPAPTACKHELLFYATCEYAHTEAAPLALAYSLTSGCRLCYVGECSLDIGS
jgi:hypothetical protein